MRKKMVLSGGTGYLGGLIIDEFKDEYDIYILTRSDKSQEGNIHYVKWDGKTLGSWTSALENADVVINLAGKNINTRFTEENKEAILKSRIDTTEIIGEAIEKAEQPPKKWLNASAVAIYKESWDEAKDEYSETDGTDFLSVVSRKWEEAFYKFPNLHTTKAVFRISLILGDSEGSALQTLKKLVKLGGGGPAGSGDQMVSWLGEEDFPRAIRFLVENPVKGAFNFCNPNVISNEELMKQLRDKYNMPIGLPAPAFLVKIGAGIIGTSPELVLRSQNVVPTRLLEEGFKFNQTRIAQI